MPAYRERVYLCPDQNGQPGWVQDFPIWWDRAEFFTKFGARRIDTGNPFHDDYGMLLTAGEALAWDEHCREQYARDPHGDKSMISDEMRRWESLLSKAGWVVIESYEWESGLD
jgi:hypothetical protein